MRVARRIANEKGIRIVRGFIEECWRNEGLEIRTAEEAARIYKPAHESKDPPEVQEERHQEPAAMPKKPIEKPVYQQPQNTGQNLESRRDLLKSLWQTLIAGP